MRQYPPIETREDMEQAFRTDLEFVAHHVNYTKSIIKDKADAEEFGTKCASIIAATFRLGVGWQEMIDALDTIDGLCLIEQAKAGPVQ